MRSLLLIFTVVCIFLFSSVVSAESGTKDQRGYQIGQADTISRPPLKRITIQIQKKKKVKPKQKTPIAPVKPIGKTLPSAVPALSPSTTHTTNIRYTVPGGSAMVGFSVTARDGIIVSAISITQEGGTSGAYQDSFTSGLT